MRALGKWSIKNNVTVNLIMVFIIMAGIFTVMKMRREVFPQFSLDMIVITVPYPGSSPEEVEEGICIKIEEEIQSIEGIKRLISTAREGNGQVLAELEKYRDQTIDQVTGKAFSEEIYQTMNQTLAALRSGKDGDN